MGRGTCNTPSPSPSPVSAGNHYRPLMASRAAYTARVGPIPDDAVIVPKWGEPSCIRPDHLWAKNKTRFHRDNQAARMFTRRVREEAKPRRYRLSPDQVRVIDGLARAARLTANAHHDRLRSPCVPGC
jgi:hypothetical protein